MKRNYLLATALAIMTLASCSENDYVGDQQALTSPSDGAIYFGFDVPAVTRAGGATAATALSNQFVVYGEKSETADGAAAAAGNLVFKNYLVQWTDNSAYTTTSNTKNWEYVGVSATSDENTNITPNSGTDAQTIKYWDYSATNYVYTAVSALPEDIQNGRVNITKITDASSTPSNKVFNKGYIIAFDKTGEAPYTYASFDKLYFSDRQVVSQGTGTDRTATNAYGGNVTLTFRNALSQIRVGIYETISGYAISDIHFYVTGDTEAKVETTDAFGAICPNIKTSTYTEALKVTYEPSGDAVNRPIVTPVTKADNTVAVTPTADLILGTNTSLVTTAAPLGTTTTSPTWDTDGGTFTPVFPQVENSTNLKLKCNYTLYNSVSGETIDVEGATAEIPADYLKWKPNFKYTYLFKISDNNNGSTGGDVVGLYPITFDAVEIVAEDGMAEYITTVSEPSITTLGVNSSTHKYVSGGSEYAAGSDIYATIMDAHAVKDFTLGTDVNVYLVTTTDATNFPITEAAVAESLAEIGGSKKITCTNENANASSKFTAVPVEVTTVPGEDGVDITGTHALKLTGAIATTETTAYAIEYIKTPATYNNNGGSVFTLADEGAFNTEVSTNGKIYTNTDCTTELTWATYSTDEDSRAATYYRRTAVKTVGTYAYKVIRVQ